jgi:hypothetical protein
VKEKRSMLTHITSVDDMDLLDEEESPLIKDESPLPTSMDINMVFTLLGEFKGVLALIKYRFHVPTYRVNV